MLQYTIVGLVLGSIYALASVSIVMTYVSTGILNFAFGAQAFFVAQTYYWMHTEKGWGILLSAGLCLFVLGPLMGLLLYVVIFRYLRLSSQLIKVVVTIGLSVAIPQIATVFFGNPAIYVTPGLAPPPGSVYHFFGAAVSLDDIIAFACALSVMALGVLVLRFTDTGLSVRAMVNSEALASLSGDDVSRTAGGVWIVSSFLAGLSGILVAPTIGLNGGAGNFITLTAAAFAAVIAARLRSLPVAVVVSLLLGVVSSLVQYLLPTTSSLTADVIPSLPFVFIVIALLLAIWRGGRLTDEGGVGGALDRAISPRGGSALGVSARSESPYPKLNFYFPVVLFGVFCLLTLVFSPFWTGQMGQAAALAVVLLSLTLVTGEGGMLWLCITTFAGVGAITTAQVATVEGWPVLVAIVIAGVLAGAIGVVIGLLTVRLGNLYVALVTLTFSLLMETLVFSLQTFSRSSGNGYTLVRPAFASSDRAFAFLSLAVFAIVSVFIVNLRRSTTGLALSAVRWSETASRTLGLKVVPIKILIAGIAAFVAGVGGGLLAVQQKQSAPTEYQTLIGLVWLAVLVTFGVRSNIAALLAAFFFTMSPTFITSDVATWLRDINIHLSTTALGVLPVLGFGVGAILLAKNPEGTVHMQAMQFERWLLKHRRVPAPGTIAVSPEGQGPQSVVDQIPSEGYRRAGTTTPTPDVAALPVIAVADDGVPALDVREITVRFGGLLALSDVSILAPKGSIVGLVGPNGAGKTTLFHVVSGLLRPEHGDVFLCGQRVTNQSPAARANLGLGRTFQQPELFLGLTVREHVVLGYRVRHCPSRIWTDTVAAGALRPEEADEEERVNHLLSLLGLETVADTQATSLPLGTSRRVEVARALATGPSVVLLDEPSSGLDVRETVQLSTALRTVVAEEKVAILLVEHDVDMVLGISSFVSVLDFGNCIASGTPDQIRIDPAVRAAYFGDEDLGADQDTERAVKQS
jgi:branched-chain amino acid transport system permease protein